jgi:arylsulfatase B
MSWWEMQTRSMSIQRFSIAVLALLFGLMATVDAATPPNILLIIADDYGIDSSSLYNTTNTGASLPPTPNIAALAQGGMLFRNAYANPICSPTRACMMTGRYGFRTGIGDVIMGPGSTVLGSSEFTLPEAFAANPALGYQLASFGKWHLNNQASSPNSVGGWPHFSGSLIGAIANYTNWTKTVNGVSTANYTNYATTDIVNDAVAWIQARGANPWFEWVAFNAPHTPFHKPPNSLCPHYTSLPGSAADINARPRLYFEAMVEAMDTEIGRLLAAVNRANTYVIFLGDNGTTREVAQPPYMATRSKGTLYEGGTRVPFIIAGPGLATPGQTNDTLVNAADVFGTVLEMAGINIAATVPTNVTLDSQSLLPALSGTNLVRYGYAEKFGTNTATPDGRALRDGQYKLIQFTTGAEEFYNLAADPYEATNLLAGTLSPTEQASYYAIVMRLGLYQTELVAPKIASAYAISNSFAVTVPKGTNVSYALWRTERLDAFGWAPVVNASVSTNGATVQLIDPSPAATKGFYRVEMKAP